MRSAVQPCWPAPLLPSWLVVAGLLCDVVSTQPALPKSRLQRSVGQLHHLNIF